MTLRGLKSTRVITPEGVRPCTVLIAAGRVERVVDRCAEAGVVDVGQLVVSPGLVDCHVHMNEPGRTEWEGFATATRAAAAGGVTTVVDMPLNSIPVTTSGHALALKVAASEGQRFVDVGFWGGVVPGNADRLADLARGGVLGCKAFLVHSGIDEFPNASESDLLAAMPLLREQGLPLLAHAELDLGARVTESDPRAYRGYLQSRPAAWEDEAIALLVDLCRRTGCAVHIVHLSSASSLPVLRAARREGLPITVETCAHYLCFDAERIPDGATHFKCAPPIREHDNREALWGALFEGVIDFVITDHSPCTPHLKVPERGDFHEAWGGISSLQLGLPAVWTEAEARGAGLAQLAHWMSTAPARFAGLSHRKGKIAAGLDADFVVWDPAAEVTVTAERLLFRHAISPYVGMTLRGQVHATYLRGELVYDGVEVAAPPQGRALLHRGDRA